MSDESGEYDKPSLSEKFRIKIGQLFHAEKISRWQWNFPKSVSSTNKAFDAIVFGVFAFLGIGAEFVVHAVGAPTVFIIAAPAAILISYAFVSTAFRRLRLRFDQIGDNCYYLGFLFTLTALSFALYNFSSNGQAIASVVANFGIALASTIIGVALRVFFVQMREDPIEVEEEARYELARASSELKSELFHAVRDMSSFRRVLQQTIVEGFEEVNETSKDAISSSARSLTAAAETAVRDLTNRNEAFNERFDTFNELSKRSVTALEALVESLEHIKPPAMILEEKLEPAVSKIGFIIGQLEKSQGLALDQYNDASATLNHMAHQAGEVANQFSSLASSDGGIAQLSGLLSGVSDGVSELLALISNTKKQFETLSVQQSKALGLYANTTDAAAKSLAEHNEAIRTELENARQMTSEVQEHLVNMARGLVRAVR